VEDRHHDLGRRTPLLLVDVGRDAAAVIDDSDRVVHMDGDLDGVAVTRQSLVDRIIDHLVNQVMKPDIAGRADIHRRTLAHCVTSLENYDLRRSVFCLCLSQF
jgi:hypothetical protein